MKLPALELRNISFSRPTGFRLKIDFTVFPGERVALMGASGSGKSTVTDLIAGFEQPDTGEILFSGRNMTAGVPSERPVSMLFQSDNLFGHLDAFSNVALGISPSMRLSKAEKNTVEQALEAVGLEEKGTRLPAALSGGERQRVAIARTLVRSKPVLLLDEPFASLGPALSAEMLKQVADLAITAHTAVVLVTHNLQEAQDFAPRVIFLDSGKIIFDGPVAQLRTRGGDAVQRYLGNAIRPAAS